MNEKNEQRKNAKILLATISGSNFDIWNISLSKNLGKLLRDEDSKKKVIGGYAPILHEPVWSIDLTADVRLAFPSFEEKMFFKLSSFDDLEKRTDFGVEILGPNTEAKKVVPDILLVPGLSFTREGKRLGRGKGFYDRYLENFRGIKIGICYECQMVLDIKTDAHDQKMDFIVTEKNIYRIRS